MSKLDSCPLCNLTKQEVISEWPNWVLARTKRLKGHKERLMLCYKDHVPSVDERSIGEAYMMLFNVGMKAFHYSRYWAILEPTYATVPEHWHRVCSDIDPVAEDHEQIIKTPRLVIDNKTLNIQRAEPGQDSVTDQ
jgi:hypothetical protein